MKINRTNILVLTIIALSWFLGQGCITTKFNTKIQPENKNPGSAYKALQFPVNIPDLKEFEVENSGDIKQLAFHAIKLYGQGEFGKAGEAFYDLSIRAKKSRNDRFQMACLTAAAISFFEADQQENLFMVTDKLNKSIDNNRFLTIPLDAYIVIAISDRLQGKQAYVPAIPDRQVRKVLGAKPKNYKALNLTRLFGSSKASNNQ